MKKQNIVKFIALIFLLSLPNFSYGNDLKNQLIGAWRSNRELTLKTFEKSKELTKEQRKLLFDPNFFGHMIHIYFKNEAITIYEGKCSKISYQIVNEGKNYVDIEYYDDFLKENVTKRLFIQADKMWIEFKKPFCEIFTRENLNDLRKKHNCINSLIMEVIK